MMDNSEAANLHRRLRKIVGQVQAIDRAVTEGKEISSEDLLSQIHAAKSALHKCGQVVLEEHIRRCVQEGIEDGNADEAFQNFTTAIDRFANLS